MKKTTKKLTLKKTTVRNLDARELQWANGGLALRTRTGSNCYYTMCCPL